MNLFPSREILFQGSNERLHRTVSREGGQFLENQQFKILWKSKRAKPLDRLSFWFICGYEKVDDVYRIMYDIRPSWPTLLSVIFSVAIILYLFYFAYVQNLGAVILCFVVLPLALIGNYFSQRSNCIHEFCKTFTVITTSRKK